MTTSPDLPLALKNAGMRATQQRLLVLGALAKATTPLSPQELVEHVASGGAAVNLVTVYRILESLEEHGLLHRHACSGEYSRCTMPGQKGLHTALHCHTCGSTEEVHNNELSQKAAALLRKEKFRATAQFLEVSGLCLACRTS